MLRQEYRASFITSNKLPSKIKFLYGGTTDSYIDVSKEEEEESSEEDLSNIGSLFDDDQKSLSQKSSLSGKVFHLPPNLLSEPLKPH